MATTRVPLGAQRLARRVTRSGGRLTSGLRMTPSFLIVGAQRCGTTSMYKTVTAHPCVLPAVLHKGVHYFDTSYDKGASWYRGHFPLEATARRVARSTGAAVVTGESSPYYMFHPLAGERIARDLPGVRVVVLLRDPVERAHSAHAHESARGFETEPFERAVALEPERLAGEEERLRADPGYRSHAHQHQAYVTRGRYVHQLERLEGLFGRDRMYVIDSGDLFTDAEPVLAGLFAFLGVPPWRPSSFEQHNARPRSSLDEALRRRLRDGYAADDERLAAWLGRPPSWRRSPDG
jgi:hypothetical protein